MNLNIQGDFQICISVSLKQLSKTSVWCHSQEYLFGKFSANQNQSICGRIFFSKIPCFQDILLNTFSSTCLNYENYSLRRILFQTLKQYLDYRSLIAETSDGNALKMKAVSVIQVMKNKERCFQLCLDRRSTLVLSPIFECPIGHPKSRAPREKFVQPEHLKTQHLSLKN